MATEGSVELSVVIPCLDGARTLGDQLQALASEQAPFDWEVVVVDNGSRDDSVEVARSFADRLPLLEIASEPIQGRHHACNRGAAVARGAYLAFVDADDVIVPGYVAAMHRALHTSDVVAGRLVHRASDAAADFGRVQTDGLMSGFGYKPYASGANLGIRTAAFLDVGGFADDVPFGEDVDLSWRLSDAGYTTSFSFEAAVVYSQRSTLRAMFRQHRRFGRAQAFLYRKYGSRGMPRRGPTQVLADWAQSARALPRLTTPGARARFVRRLARNVGRAQGSVSARVMYL